MGGARIFFLVGLLFSFAARAGHDVGGGGDAVLCRLAPESRFEGYYALDYLLTYREGDVLRPVASWEDSARQILERLAARSAYLHDSFADFVRWSGNEDDYTAPRIWERAGFGLVAIDDQQIINRLPANCYTRSGPQTIDVIQSVIRKQLAGTVVYSFDPKILSLLKTQRALQYSFLMVHEWLRDFTDDVPTIRRLNQLLHARALDALDEEAFYRTLDNLGVTNSPRFQSVCDRTAQLRAWLEKNEGRNCDSITQVHPEPTGASSFYRSYLRLNRLGITELRARDFSGLGAYQILELQDNRLRALPEWLFRPMAGPLTISLANNQLEALYGHLFDRLPIDFVSFSGNRLRTLPERLFARAQHVYQIRLDHNALTELPPAIFREAPGLVDIDLRYNQLRDLPEEIFAGPKIHRVLLYGNPLDPGAESRLKNRYGAVLKWSVEAEF